MEYAEGGDLKSFISKRLDGGYDYIQQDLIIKWALQIVEVLQYLHRLKILHRDIKAENVFLTAEEDIKLGDFGISKILCEGLDYAQTGVGTPYFLSPEICQGAQYNHKTDTWTLGCLLYEMCSLERPFVASSIKELINKIINTQPEPLKCLKYSNDLKKIVFDLLQKDPNDRPELKEVESRLKTILNTSACLGSKLLDAKKLTIEVEDQEPSSSEIKFSYPSPIDSSNLNTGTQKESTETKKLTPSYTPIEIAKIMQNLKISPIIRSKTKASSNTFKTNSTTTNNTPTSTQNLNPTPVSNFAKTTRKNSMFVTYRNSQFGLNAQEVKNKLKTRHYRHISIDISSIQSPNHQEAIYEYEKVDFEKMEFPSPYSKAMVTITKPTYTPTNILQTNANKISPKESLKTKEKPNTTKVANSNIKVDYEYRHKLVHNFLYDRFGKEKFEKLIGIINEFKQNATFDKKQVGHQLLNLLGKEEYKVAINYIKFLINGKSDI